MEKRQSKGGLNEERDSGVDEEMNDGQWRSMEEDRTDGA